MGRDKALVPFMDGTMIEYLLAQLNGLGQETIIISNTPHDYQRFGFPVFEDVIPGIGALGGVYTALYHASQDICLLLACDMPYVNLGVIQLLLAHAADYDVVVPRIRDGLIEPFRAVYNKRNLPVIKQSITSGERKVISFFDRVDVKYIEEDEIKLHDPEMYSFFNVNTPDELAQAQQLARRGWPSGQGQEGSNA